MLAKGELHREINVEPSRETHGSIARRLHFDTRVNINTKRATLPASCQATHAGRRRNSFKRHAGFILSTQSAAVLARTRTFEETERARARPILRFAGVGPLLLAGEPVRAQASTTQARRVAAPRAPSNLHSPSVPTLRRCACFRFAVACTELLAAAQLACSPERLGRQLGRTARRWARGGPATRGAVPSEPTHTKVAERAGGMRPATQHATRSEQSVPDKKNFAKPENTTF